MPYPAKLSCAAVVEASTQLIDSEGLASLGMRAVAERLAVRPASLYKHVGDLATLQALLAEQAAERLLARMHEALRAETDPADPSSALRLMAREYVAFARAHPAQYTLLASDTTGTPSSAAHPYAQRKALWNALLDAVAPLTANADDTDAAVAVWAFLHGFVSLEMAGLYGPSGPRGGLARGIDALVDGLRDRPR